MDSSLPWKLRRIEEASELVSGSTGFFDVTIKQTLDTQKLEAGLTCFADFRGHMASLVAGLTVESPEYMWWHLKLRSFLPQQLCNRTLSCRRAS